MPNMRTLPQQQKLYADCRLAFPDATDADCTNFGYNTKNGNTFTTFFSKKPTLAINGVSIKNLDDLRAKVATSGGKRTKRRKMKRKTRRN